jgi:hypothetical protein
VQKNMIVDQRNDTPLIYTADRGNFPMAELDFKTEWEILPEAIRLTETYTFKDNGQVARKSVHVLTRQALSSNMAGGAFQ